MLLTLLPNSLLSAAFIEASRLPLSPLRVRVSRTPRFPYASCCVRFVRRYHRFHRANQRLLPRRLPRSPPDVRFLRVEAEARGDDGVSVASVSSRSSAAFTFRVHPLRSRRQQHCVSEFEIRIFTFFWAWVWVGSPFLWAEPWAEPESPGPNNYGGESTSLNLNQLWKRFKGDDKPPVHLGTSREYNVDMVPKFMMANGALVRVLIHTSVTKYLNFKAVDGNYVYNKGKIYKVPATDVEALKSTLMGLFEKRRARKFFIYVQDYEEDDPKSHEGLDLHKVTTREVISKYGLDDNTIDFIGHALALHRDDSYLDVPAIDTVKRMKLYAESLARFRGGSPYIYPLYDLGELPQGFARLSAVYGGTYMLNKPECKVEFASDGKVCGVTSEGES